MATKKIGELGVDVFLDANFKEFGKNLDKLAKGLEHDFTHAIKELDKSGKAFSKSFGKQLKEGMDHGLNVKEQEKQFNQLSKAHARYTKEAMAYSYRASKAAHKEDKKALMDLRDLRINLAEGVHRKLMALEGKRSKAVQKAKKDQQDLVDLFGTTGESFKKRFADGLEKSTKGIASNLREIIQGLRSGDLSSVFKGGVGGLEKAGGAARAYGRGGKVGAGAAGALGKGLGSLAKALGPIAAIAAVLGVVVKLLVDSESKTKELNKSFLDTVGSTALAGEGYKSLSRNIETVTSQAADFNRFLKMGLNAQEYMQVAAAMDQAGVSVRRLTGDFTSPGRLQEAIYGAQVVATEFGITATEAVQNIGETVENLNMGYSETVDRLTMISRLAKDSGFNTKRFYSTVLSATTGMTMYNVRLEEAGTRLIQLTRAVGKQQAIQMLPGMAGGFKDASMQERIQMLRMTPRKNRVFQAESRVLSARADAGLKGTGQTIAGVAGMGRKDQTKFLSNLEADPKTLKLAQLVKNALEARRAATGKEGAQMLGMDQLSIGGKLAFQQSQLSKFVRGGFRNLDKANAIQLMAAEKITGMGASEMKANARYFKSMEGVFNVLKDSDMNDPDAQIALAEKFGLKLDKNGDLLSKDGEYLGANIKDGFDEFLMASGNQAKIDEKVLKDQRTLMEEQVDLTQTLGDKIDQGITYFLEKIWRTTNALLDRFSVGNAKAQDELKTQDLLEKERKRLKARKSTLVSKKSRTKEEEAELARTSSLLDEIYSGGSPFGDMGVAAAKSGYTTERGKGFHAPKGAILTPAEEEARFQLRRRKYAGMDPNIIGKNKPKFGSDAQHGLDDFIYTGGRAIPINNQDEFIGGKVGGGAVSAIIDSQVDTQLQMLDTKKDIVKKLNDQLKADKKYRRKFHDRMQGRYPEAFAEKYIEALELKEFGEFLSVIGLSGPEREAALKQYARNQTLTDAAKAGGKAYSTGGPDEYIITGTTEDGMPKYEKKGKSRAKELGERYPGFEYQDYVWRSGASAPIAFSPDDNLIAMKDFSKLGMGGGATINIYGGDERKIWNVVQRAMKASGGYA